MLRIALLLATLLHADHTPHPAKHYQADVVWIHHYADQVDFDGADGVTVWGLSVIVHEGKEELAVVCMIDSDCTVPTRVEVDRNARIVTVRRQGEPVKAVHYWRDVREIRDDVQRRQVWRLPNSIRRAVHSGWQARIFP